MFFPNINHLDPSFVLMDPLSWHPIRRGAFDSLISDLHASNLERRARSSITRDSRVPWPGGWVNPQETNRLKRDPEVMSKRR